MDKINISSVMEDVDIIASSKRPDTQKDIMADYVPVKKPRSVNPNASEVGKTKIKTNLRILNENYIEHPSENEVVKQTDKTKEKKMSLSTRALCAIEEIKIKRKKIEIKAVSSGRIVTKVDKDKKPFPFAGILCAFLFTAVFMYMLSLYVQIDDYSSQIVSLKNEMAELVEEETALKIKIENKFNLAMVEKIATEEYGMVKADNLPKKYITVTEDDVTEIYKTEPKSGLGVLLSAFGSALRALLE